MQKTSVIVTHNKTRWALGGQWTAGGGTPKKPGNIKRLAADGGFDVGLTSAVWLKDEAQVGFYTFEKKEKSARSLAWSALQQLGAKDFPWRGLFNLGDDVWWLLAVDHSGTVHPRWDICGDEKTIRRIISDNIADLAPFNPSTEIVKPEESWDWLLSDLTKTGPSVVPVTSLENIAKKLLVTGLLIGGVGLGAVYMADKHMDAEKAARLAQQKAARMAQMLHMQHLLALKAAQSKAMDVKLAQYYAQYPRPWTSSASNADIIRECLAEMQKPLSNNGWVAHSISCSVTGSDMTIKKIWGRNILASIHNRPSGNLNFKNGIVTSTTHMVLPVESASNQLPNSSQVFLNWVANSQVYGQPEKYTLQPLSPYTIPKPPFEMNNKNFKSKILWQEGQESITSFLSPANNAWTALDSLDFFIKRINIELTVEPQYTINGVQYGKF